MSSIYEQLSKADTSQKSEITDADVAIPKLAVARPAPRESRSAFSRFMSVLSFLLLISLCAAAGYIYFLLEEAKTERANLAAQYAELRGTSEAAKEQNFGYRTEMDDLQKEFQKLRNDSEVTKKELERGRDDFARLERKVNIIQDKSSQIEAAVLELSQQGPVYGPVYQPTPDPEPSTYENFSEEVSAPQVSVPTENTSVNPVPAISYPQVMTVNRKFNFLVINMGMKDNLRMGDRLAIEREGKIIGSVAIEKLYDNFAAAAIVEEREDGAIKEGDIVRKS